GQSAVSNFTYDANGNMATYQTNQGSFANREMIWDQQNRLMAVVDDNTNVSHYVYDHAGERTFKAVGTVSTVNIGGAEIYSVLDFDQYTLYPSGYMVIDPGKQEYSKHYYINSKRFASRLGNSTEQFLSPMSRTVYDAKSNEMNETQSDGLDLGAMVGAQYTTYGIETPGNSEADCLLQLQDILDEYANNNPPTASVTHCINRINQIINESDTSCEALVEVNKYVCTPVDINDPGNEPVDPNDPTLTPIQIEQADCLTELNILAAQLAAQIQNGGGSVFFEWYQCINYCIVERNLSDSYGCWERLIYGDGEWPSSCNIVFSECGCDNQPVITELNKCPALAMIYIDTHLAADLSNACAVLNYVKQHYKCVPSPLEPEEEPVKPIDEDDDWKDEGGNDNEPEEDYNEYLRKPIWWYHTDHLGSSTYLTDNFGRPSHYYETLPFGEMILEHNQSKYYKIPYPTTNTGSYDNKFKFNGKELDDATGMYYYGARYYDPRISIFVSVDPLAEQTMEPYLYTGNNPIMFTDPTGMSKNPPPINLYLVQRHTNTVLNYSYSRGNLQRKIVGSGGNSYHATPYYNSSNNLVGFGMMTENNRLDYVVPKAQYNNFVKNLDTYREAADLFNQNGTPSANEIKMVAALQSGNFGEAMSAVGDMWNEDGAKFRALVSSVSGVGGGIAARGGFARSVGSFDDIISSPKSLRGMSVDEVGAALGEGWAQGAYGSKGNGWKFTKGDKSVFYHPGGGVHKGSYYGFSSGKTGKVKVVSKEYVPTANDKATIIK
ncbi:MAG: RHS repeat-associated core domain-containing protein, partial [Flavobacterium sp.]